MPGSALKIFLRKVSCSCKIPAHVTIDLQTCTCMRSCPQAREEKRTHKFFCRDLVRPGHKILHAFHHRGQTVYLQDGRLISH